MDFDNPAFDQFWSNIVILDADPLRYEPNLRVTKYGNEVRLFIDDIQYDLSDLKIDFGFDQFRNITFFTNSNTNEFEDKNDVWQAGREVPRQTPRRQLILKSARAPLNRKNASFPVCMDSTAND